MMPSDEQAADELMRLVGAALERQDDDLALQSEAQLAWLASDLRGALSSDEHAADERDADAFARDMVARLAIQRAQRALPRRELQSRPAPMVATVAQGLHAASEHRAAVMLDLAAAAGAGRAIWDEPCDTWLELPSDIPSSPYVALRVAGDSMEPVLAARDVILVKLDAPPTVDDLVVARLADDGFVVKRVAGITSAQLTLASFNPAYAPLVVERVGTAILGTVIARFSRL
ncbi:MAG: Peptidase conserved region [Gemmatimonadetes bacterium]|nr:Peptidase conserved region [Gemmatimonadota bacterium]